MRPGVVSPMLGGILATLWLVSAAPPAAAQDRAPQDRPAPRFAVKPLVSYGKGSLSLRPAPESSLPWRRVKAGQEAVPVFQPNVGPSLGLALELSEYLTVGAARAVEAWQPDPGARGHAQVTHLEVHSQWRGIGLDGFRQEYRGLYRTQVAGRSARPMADSLLDRRPAQEIRDDLRLLATGVGLLLVVDPVAFPLRAVMQHKVPPRSTGWSPLVHLRYEELDLAGDGPLLTDPSNLEAFGPAWSGLSGLRASTLSLAPGLGGVFVTEGCYLTAAANWGLGIQDQNLRGAVGRRHNALAAAGSLRGSIATQRDWLYAGVNGHKAITTLNAPGIAITHTVSMVEVFAGARF